MKWAYRCLLVGAAVALQSCATARKVATLASGRRPALFIAESQRSFARFVPVGEHSAKLRTEFTLNESTAPLGIMVQVCQAPDRAAYGVEITTNNRGVVLDYLAGRAGEVILEVESARCETGQGIKGCARMHEPQEFALCFNASWEAELKAKGEGFEVSPARIDLRWSCTRLGYCSWTRGGSPPAGGDFKLVRIRHFDQATADTYQDKQLWIAGGFGLADRKSWVEAGFTLVEASLWEKGIQPIDAARWKEAGWSLDEHRAWMKKTRFLSAAIKWRKLGFSLEDYEAWTGLKVVMDADIASRWREAGYSPKAAEQWIDAKIEKPAEAAVVERACPKGLEPIDALFEAKPAAAKGRCFGFVGTTQKLLSESTGIFLLGGEQPAFLSFGARPAPPRLFRGIAKGLGTHEHREPSGGTASVPSLEVVLVQESR